MSPHISSRLLHPTFSTDRNAWTVYSGHRLDHPFERVTGYHPSKGEALAMARSDHQVLAYGATGFGHTMAAPPRTSTGPRHR